MKDRDMCLVPSMVMNPSWNRETVYRNYGYDKFYSVIDFDLDDIRGWAISDKSFFKQSLDISLKMKSFLVF